MRPPPLGSPKRLKKHINIKKAINTQNVMKHPMLSFPYFAFMVLLSCLYSSDGFQPLLALLYNGWKPSLLSSAPLRLCEKKTQQRNPANPVNPVKKNIIRFQIS